MDRKQRKEEGMEEIKRGEEKGKGEGRKEEIKGKKGKTKKNE